MALLWVHTSPSIRSRAYSDLEIDDNRRKCMELRDVFEPAAVYVIHINLRNAESAAVGWLGCPTYKKRNSCTLFLFRPNRCFNQIQPTLTSETELELRSVVKCDFLVSWNETQQLTIV